MGAFTTEMISLSLCHRLVFFSFQVAGFRRPQHGINLPDALGKTNDILGFQAK
jgi:hypothetical protein